MYIKNSKINSGIKIISLKNIDAIIPIVDTIMENASTINALSEWEAPVLSR